MRGELTARQADAELGGIMFGLAGLVVGSVNASGNAIAAAREQRQVYAYADALERATQHARVMERIALESMEQIASLEAKIASLEAACVQRQEHIDVMRGRING